MAGAVHMVPRSASRVAVFLATACLLTTTIPLVAGAEEAPEAPPAPSMKEGPAPATGDLVVDVAGQSFVRAEGAATMSGRSAQLASRGSAQAAGAAGVPVYYPSGEPATDDNRFYGTDRVIIRADEAPLPGKNGLLAVEPVKDMPGWYVGTVQDAWAAPDAANGLRAESGVHDAYVDLARVQSKRAAPSDPLYADQWHLKNTGQNGATPGIDANVESVWDTITGAGINVSVVDDGLDHAHPDLAANYDPTFSADRCDGDADPAPGPADAHGTAVAGVTGAVANNAEGVSGVAPGARLSAQRLIACASSDAMEAAALNANTGIFVSTNSWGPADSGLVLGAPGPLTRAAIANATNLGRDGLGTVFTWAVGNGLDNGDDGNYDGYANNRRVIAVAAVTDSGEQPFYSETCACTLVSAPSNGGIQGITTTDSTTVGYNTGTELGEPTDTNYTSSFGGTSSATPLVAGVVALALEANPALTWRDVQGVLIESADPSPLVGGEWTINGAGLLTSPQFGFGMVDAAGAVARAQSWVPFGAERVAQTTLTPNPPLAIPDDDPGGAVVVLGIGGPEPIEIERVELNISITHTWRGDIEINLISPSLTESRLLPGRAFDSGDNFVAWTMTSAQFYGELAAGNWVLEVLDESAFDVGSITGVTLTVYGHAPRAPAQFLLSGLDVSACTTAQAGDLVTCAVDVTNAGTDPATGALRLLQDGVAIDVEMLTLAPSQTETVTFQFAQPLAGVFDMAFATAADDVAWTLTVAGAPDLVVEEVLMIPSDPVEGDNVFFLVVVKNQGTDFVTGTFLSDLQPAFADLGGIDEGFASHWFTLAPDATSILRFPEMWRPPAGATSVQFNLDVGGAIVEGDELNNAFTHDFVVLPADPASDSDMDTVPFSDDVCPGIWDAGQEDADADGVGDACQASGTAGFDGTFGVPTAPPPPGFPGEILIVAYGNHRGEAHVGSWDEVSGEYVVSGLAPGPYVLVGYDLSQYVILPGDHTEDFIGFAEENDCSIVLALPDFSKNLNFNISDPFKFFGCSFDSDGDGIDDNDELPGCAFDPNPDCVGFVSDYDFDGVGDSLDNCPWTFNPDQSDLDGDMEGDACETDLDGDGIAWWDDADDDGDGVADEFDNCPAMSNADQANADADKLGDACEFDGTASFTGTFDAPAGFDAANLGLGLFEPARQDVRLGEWNHLTEEYVITDVPGGKYILFGFNASMGETPLDVPDSERGFGEESNCGIINVEDGSEHAVSFAMGDRFLTVGCPAGAVPDTDYDGVLEPFDDNCPGIYNPDQTDSDGDGIGDACPRGDTNVDVSVVDGSGVPVSGVNVEVYGDWSFNDVQMYRSSFTGPDGIAPIQGLAAGHFIARACQPGLGCGEQAFLADGNTDTVLLPDGGDYTLPTETIELQLRSDGGGYRPPNRFCGGTLKGTLVTSGGSPVPNASVNVGQHYDPAVGFVDVSPLNGWGWAQTDSSGNFVITNLGASAFDLYVDGWSVGLPGLSVQEAFSIGPDADIARCGVDAELPVINTTAFPTGAYGGLAGDRHQFVLAEGLTISGTVYGPDGPLEGVQVNAWTRWAPGFTGQHSWAGTTTEADGTFRLRGLIPIDDLDEATGFDIQVFPGYGPDAPEVGSANLFLPEAPVQGTEDTGSPLNPDGAGVIDPRLDFVLRAGASLRGNVTDQDGNPLVDGSGNPMFAWVNMWSTNWSNPSWGGAGTDADGAYRIGGLLAGEEYEVMVWPPWGSGLGTGRALVEIADGANYLDFQLSRGTALSGCVVGPDGADDGTDPDPVPGAWLSVTSRDGLPGGWGNTAYDFEPDRELGCFEILGLAAGTYDVYIYPPWNPSAQLISRQFTVTLDTDSAAFDDDILDANDAGDEFLLHDQGALTILLSGGGVLRGCLVDGAGDPVAGAWVNAWSGTAMSGNGAQSAFAGDPDLDEGCFRITGLGAGTDYYFNVWPPFDSGLREFNLQEVVVTPPGETLVVDGIEESPGVNEKILLGSGHHLVGDVVDENGNPIANVGICAWREDSGAFGWAMTDANGHFDIRGLELPGDADDKQGWFLWLGVPSGYIPRNYPMDPYRAEWDSSYAPSPFDVNAADNEDTTQPDSPTGQSITDRGLTFGTTARLVITLSTDDTRTYVDTNWDTNGDGTVDIDDDVFDSDGDGLRGSADAADEDNEYGDADGEQPIVLGTGKTMPGFVLDEAGAGIPDANVWMWGPAGWGSATTNAAGAFNVSGLADGAFDVWVSLPDGRSKYETGGGLLEQGCQVGATGDDRALGVDADAESVAGCVIQFESPGSIVVQVDAGDDDSGVYTQVFGPGWASGHTGDDDQATDTESSESVSNADSTLGDVFGEIRFDDLAPGSWTVRLYRADCYVLFQGDVVVTSGQVTTVTVTLVSAGTLMDLEGQVLAEGGLVPLPNALVIANLDAPDADGDGQPDVTTYTTSTDATGRYFFDDIPEGNYVVKAIVDATHQASQTIALDATDATDPDGADADGVFDSDSDGIANAPTMTIEVI